MTAGIKNIIDRQLFELFCSRENTAVTLQQQVTDFVAPALQDIIADIFRDITNASATRAGGEDNYRIDRLEIDLGHFKVNEFGGQEMLDRFRTVCTEKLVEYLGTRQFDQSTRRFFSTAPQKSGDLLPAAPSAYGDLFRKAPQEYNPLFPQNSDPLFTQKTASLFPEGLQTYDPLLPGTLRTSGHPVPSDYPKPAALFPLASQNYNPLFPQNADPLLAQTSDPLLPGALQISGHPVPSDRPKPAALFPMAPLASGNLFPKSSQNYNSLLAQNSDPLLAQNTIPLLTGDPQISGHPTQTERLDNDYRVPKSSPSSGHPIPKGPSNSGELLRSGPRDARKHFPSDLQWEMTRSFLIDGDLPWWVDKSMLPDMDKVLSLLIEQHPEILRSLFEEAIWPTAILKRMQWQYVAATRKSLKAILPVIPLQSPTLLHSQIIALVASERNPELLHPQLITLVASQRKKWSGYEKLFRNRAIKSIVASALKWPHQIPPQSDDSPIEDSHSDELPGRKAQIAAEWIARKLITKGQLTGTDLQDRLCRHLIRWPKDQLFAMEKKWQRAMRNEVNVRRLRQALASHPQILFEDLLTTIAMLFQPSPHQPFSTEPPTASLSALRWLMPRPGDRDLLKKILQEGAADGTKEKKLLTRLLANLPAQAILTLDECTKLPQTALKELLSPGKEITTNFKTTQESTRQERALVENAGLCLLAPYLPYLYRNLAYTRDNKFVNKRTAWKAIHLLQYLATGITGRAPEYLLPLNKLLTGIGAAEPVPALLRLNKKDRTEADKMLEAVIANWPALKNTSPDGIRGTFLCRKGILKEEATHWVLQVERKEYDILLNGINWSYTMMKFPWMEKYIMVEW